MQKLTCLILFVVAVMAQANDKPQYDLANGPALFEKYIQDHNKVYKDDADKEVHYQEFLKSLKIINEANAADSGATFDLNDFSDYTPEQRKNMFGLKID